MPTTKKNSGKRPDVSFLMLGAREVGAAEFKAHCLELMNDVERLGTELVVTRHRKPMVRIVPAHTGKQGFCGSLAGMVLEEHDLIAPIEMTWEADESDPA